jgi:hypothetical protein
MANVLDVFKSDGFSMMELTAALNKLPHQPGRIGELGLFESSGITKTVVAIEERDGVLALLPTVARGGPSTAARTGRRTVRNFTVPHIPYEDAIFANDIQDVRQFGSEDTLQGVAQVVNDRLAEMKRSHDVTLEYHRMGALNGKILDADGSTVIYNLFTEFGVTEQTQEWVLGTDTTEVQAICHSVHRKIESALGGTRPPGVHTFCGADFFDDLVSHDSVKAAVVRYQESMQMRTDVRRGFEFGGIFFEEYVGSVGDVDFIESDECRSFPVGVPIYKTYNAPGNFVEAANTIGLEMYAKQQLMDFDRGVRLLTESNPLNLCLRPAALVKGTTN